MRRLMPWFITLILAALLTGCSSGSPKMAAPAETPRAEQTGNVAADQAMKPPSDGASPGAGTDLSLDQKLIRNAEIELRVKEIDDAIASISQQVRAAGGYTQGSRIEGTRTQGRRANLVVRVPSSTYGSTLDQISALGERIHLEERILDVTEEYLDLDARIKTKEVHLSRLQQLYNQGGSIKELMELEQEIARVTAELESIKGRFNYLSNQVAFSTFTIALYEPGAPSPIKPPQTIWERMQLGFVSNWNGLINLMGDLAVLTVSLIPQLIFLAILGLLVWGIARLLLRRSAGRAPKIGATNRPVGGTGGSPTEGYAPTYAPPLPSAETKEQPKQTEQATSSTSEEGEEKHS